MYEITRLSINELLSPNGYRCSCGRIHKAGIKKAIVAPNAVHELPEMLKELKVTKPFIVTDKNTLAAAGETVCELLKKAGVDYALYTFPQISVEPDEHSVGQVITAFDNTCDGVVGVGSGCINDICKVVTKAVRLPYMIVGTAPSMDGYASNSAAMIVSGVKVSVYTNAPDIIIADTEIMRNAPAIMLASGFGDIMAKYVSVGEWRISNMITGEYYCPEIAALVRASVKKCADAASGLKNREPEAVNAVVEGLILSGIAMAYAGISRPASGLEHYFSHIWEMHSVDGKVPKSLHGIQCGIGTVLTLGLYEWYKKQTFSREKAMAAINSFDRTAWESEIRRIFGSSAEKVLEIDRETGKSSRETFIRHMEKIEKHLPDIDKVIAEEFPSSEHMKTLLKTVGAPVSPYEIGLDEKETVDAFYASKEIRDKYITSRMFWEEGILDDAAEELKKLL